MSVPCVNHGPIDQIASTKTIKLKACVWCAPTITIIDKRQHANITKNHKTNKFNAFHIEWIFLLLKQHYLIIFE